jgi:hypothetical protein
VREDRQAERDNLCDKLDVANRRTKRVKRTARTARPARPEAFPATLQSRKSLKLRPAPVVWNGHTDKASCLGRWRLTGLPRTAWTAWDCLGLPGLPGTAWDCLDCLGLPRTA